MTSDVATEVGQEATLLGGLLSKIRFEENHSSILATVGNEKSTIPTTSDNILRFECGGSH